MLAFLIAAVVQEVPAQDRTSEDRVLREIVKDIPTIPDRPNPFVQAPASPRAPRALTRAEQDRIARLVSEELADPGSAQFQWYPVTDELTYCGRVNAKNRFGGYVGFKPFIVTYEGPSGARTPRALVASNSGLQYVREIREHCVARGYAIATAP